MKYFICFRPIKWFFRKNWYAKRPVDQCKQYWIIDFGSITIGKRKDEK